VGCSGGLSRRLRRIWPAGSFGCENYGIRLFVLRELLEDLAQVTLYGYRSEILSSLFSLIFLPLGGSHKQKIPIVPTKKVASQYLGILRIKGGPHGHIEVLMINRKHGLEEIWPAASVPHMIGRHLIIELDVLVQMLGAGQYGALVFA
jgi:hypothetical protein